MTRVPVVLCTTIAMFACCTHAAQNRTPGVPRGVKVLKDLDYAGTDDPRQKLDLYLPETPSGRPMPVIVWIHGGAWLGGSKDGNPAARFVPQGYASASIGYRLSHQAIFPAQIHDCKAAIRWLRAHAKEYNLDPNRIGVWGASAGGHLVALLGVTGEVPELEGKVGKHLDQSSAVQAVCDWFGPTDLALMGKQAPADSKINHDAPDSPESRLVGSPVQENKEKTAAASPISYVAKAKKLPPFLILHGDKDNVVPFGQSEIFNEALKKAGATVTFIPVKDASHGGPAFNSPENRKAVEEFFAKHLAGGKSE